MTFCFLALKVRKIWCCKALDINFALKKKWMKEKRWLQKSYNISTTTPPKSYSHQYGENFGSARTAVNPTRILVVKFFWLAAATLSITGTLSPFSPLMPFNPAIPFIPLYPTIGNGFIASWLIGIAIGACWDWTEVRVGVVFWVDELGSRVRVLCNSMLQKEKKGREKVLE